jgi:hypothetical protein
MGVFIAGYSIGPREWLGLARLTGDVTRPAPLYSRGLSWPPPPQPGDRQWPIHRIIKQDGRDGYSLGED